MINRESLRISAKKKSGFTLVELLIVITIIGALAGFLMSAVMEAREKGREVICINNLKQIGAAVTLYTLEWNGYTPAVFPDLNDPQMTGMIYVTLSRYLDNPDVFWCPSSGLQRRWDGLDAPRANEPVSYGFNSNGTASQGDYTGFCTQFAVGGRYRNIGEVVASSELIVATESFQDKEAGSQSAGWEYIAYYSPENQLFGPGFLHRGGVNVLFADGHVAWHSYNYLRNTIHIWNMDNSNVDFFP